MARLERANQDLRNLVAYLQEENTVSTGLDFRLAHDKHLDKDNLQDPRAFCAVAPKDTIISCTQYIERLPQDARIGVLLHEIAHIQEQAFAGDECEVDADVWILENVPEANYHYGNVRFIRNSEAVTAENLQMVSAEFARKIRGQ